MLYYEWVIFMPKEFIFVCSILFCVFLYRTIISIQIVRKKKFIIDEQSYILFAYLTLLALITILTKNISIGVIMLALSPLVLLIYFMIIKVRVFWIVNGVDTNLASYGNALIDKIPAFADTNYMKEHIIFRKVEGKIKVNMEKLNFEEKEKVLQVLNETAKQHTKEVSGKQTLYLVMHICLTFLFLFLLILSI